MPETTRSGKLSERVRTAIFTQSAGVPLTDHPLNEYEETEVEGEVYISIPQVQRNAKKFNEPFAKELARVIIHGNLHLLDYKDQTPDEKEVMTEKEEYFLESSDWIGIV